VHQIIEADGVNTKPLAVDQVQIFAGQRYSLVMAADQDVDNYWIRANPNNGAAQGFANGINSAILRYIGADDVEPTTSQATPAAPLVEANLQASYFDFASWTFLTAPLAP
jgi:iron transport multicopper oxidase